MRWTDYVVCMGEMRYAYKILVGKPDWKRQFGRPRCRWSNIRVDLGKIEWEVVNWSHLAQEWCQWRILVNTFP